MRYKENEKMKINGTDIKEYGKDFLTSRLGIMQAAINIAGVVLSVIVAAGLVFFGFMWSIYDLSNALPFLAFIPAFGLIFGFPMIFLLREKKGIMQELRSRFKKPEDMANIEATIKKKSRKSLIVMIGIIALALIVVLGMVLSGTEGTNSSDSENTCGSCGRSWSAGDSGRNYRNIARTGLCKNCEANYHSLKDVLD